MVREKFMSSPRYTRKKRVLVRLARNIHIEASEGGEAGKKHKRIHSAILLAALEKKTFHIYLPILMQGGSLYPSGQEIEKSLENRKK